MRFDGSQFALSLAKQEPEIDGDWAIGLGQKFQSFVIRRLGIDYVASTYYGINSIFSKSAKRQRQFQLCPCKVKSSGIDFVAHSPGVQWEIFRVQMRTPGRVFDAFGVVGGGVLPESTRAFHVFRFFPTNRIPAAMQMMKPSL